MNEKQWRAQLSAMYIRICSQATVPLRWFSKNFQITRNFSIPLSRLLDPLRCLPRVILGKVVSQPLLRQLGLKVLIYFPRLKIQLKKIMLNEGVRVAKYKSQLRTQASLSQIKSKNLTADAQKILHELHHLIQKKKY